jgi:hypothetical protein
MQRRKCCLVKIAHADGKRSSRKHHLSHNDADLMVSAIVGERDIWEVSQRLAVHFDQSDAA